MYRLAELRDVYRKLRQALRDYSKEQQRKNYEALFLEISEELAAKPKDPYGWSNPLVRQYIRGKHVEQRRGVWYV